MMNKIQMGRLYERIMMDTKLMPFAFLPKYVYTLAIDDIDKNVKHLVVNDPDYNEDYYYMREEKFNQVYRLVEDA